MTTQADIYNTCYNYERTQRRAAMAMDRMFSTDAGQAVARRIIFSHVDLLERHGLERVIDAIENCTCHLTDLDEIGTSDVSCWVLDVKRELDFDTAPGGIFRYRCSACFLLEVGYRHFLDREP